jgi:hypothetical protein
MFFPSFFLPSDDDYARERHRRGLQRVFLREARDATDVVSSVRQMGSKGIPFLKSLKAAYLESSLALPDGHEVRISANICSRPIEAVIGIAHGTSEGVITTIDYLSRLRKPIPCELTLEKLDRQKYRVVADDSGLRERFSQDPALWQALYGALRESYQDGANTIRIEEGFAMKPEPDGTVICLRTTPVSVWWSMGLLLELGVKQFLDVIDRIDDIV